MAAVTNTPLCKDVAVAIIKRGDGKVLFAERPSGKACAGEWEFPGGKIEAGESARQALDREIREELAISITEARPWVTLAHSYPHASVLLHFFIVTAWTGHEHGEEGQRLSWQNLSQLTISPLLAANEAIIRALLLPNTYAISCAGEIGEEKFMGYLPKAIENGLRMLQIREKNMPPCQLEQLVDRVLSVTEPAGVTTLINSAIPVAQRKYFSGIHLTSLHLMKLDQRPDFELVAGSCHNLAELNQAVKLELDFVVLSPILKTASHPDAMPIGITGMSKIIAEYPIPVYALGGMTDDHLTEMQSHGAHGIAMMRNAWK
ncbi:MAG: Nudix family hydrolase [Gammaproteobacteria bacterium]|nr:Nudix family hydrolase [Gammaproteobacteria bacterium]